MIIEENLENYLLEYKEITMELMNRVSIQGNRLFLLNKRQELIEQISRLDYKHEHLKKIIDDLEIYKIESVLKQDIALEMISIKKQIAHLKKGQKGNKAYRLASNIYGGYIPSRIDKMY